MNYFTKTHVFFYFLLLIAVLLLYKTISLPSAKIIDISILKQKGNIINLNTEKRSINSKIITVDTLHFPQSSTLFHKSLGPLGFSNNFFLDAQVDMNVLQNGTYRFAIASDDGFRLIIDNKNICAFVHDRAYKDTICKVDLKKGKHNFKLNYFQAKGPLGLHVKYAIEGKPFYTLGQDTEFIEFERVKND